jgi:D-xylose transport system ATP-binding protein
MDVPRRIVRSMIGRELDEAYPKSVAPLGECVLELRNWTVANPVPGRPALVQNVGLALRAGEVLGIFGLIGSGASDLARSMFGMHAGRSSGEFLLHGRPMRARRPADAIRAGLAYMPSDRKRDGLVLQMPVAANLSLAALRRFTHLGLIDRGEELRQVQHYVSALQVKCASVDQPVGGLSGGNQQKVVAAKWLLAEPDVLLLEEPTRGVDVGARLEIYNLINNLTRAGKAVVLISNDLSEVLGMSDRVLAMRDGRLAGSWARGAASEEDVMLHAAGRQEDNQ